MNLESDGSEIMQAVGRAALVVSEGELSLAEIVETISTVAIQAYGAGIKVARDNPARSPVSPDAKPPDGMARVYVEVGHGAEQPKRYTWNGEEYVAAQQPPPAYVPDTIRYWLDRGLVEPSRKAGDT